MGTACVVVGVAVVAGYVSYRHAYEFVRANGEEPTAAALVPLTVDGLIFAASLTALETARRGGKTPVLARLALGLGMAASITANVSHGLGHGLAGALVAGWPAVALILVFELLLTAVARPVRLPGVGTRGYGVLETVSGAGDVPIESGTEDDSDSLEPFDPLLARAEDVFRGDLAAGRCPSIRAIRAALSIGQPKAQRVRAYLDAVLAEQPQPRMPS
ncbi:DUF2637 domain-containing protein [Actinomadura barringtoniae]|uniref:DUF2637 domain-containing protein n=1 Tax=Actinomadura barringtoniae TaxID=1427535 RepID=UPI003556EF88